MVDTSTPNAGVNAPVTQVCLGSERLLGIPDVCRITGLAEATASKLMKESGRAIRVHSRLFILETSFFNYLRELEVNQPCSR